MSPRPFDNPAAGAECFLPRERFSPPDPDRSIRLPRSSRSMAAKRAFRLRSACTPTAQVNDVAGVD
jgi:hypothetical protein